MKKLYLFLMIVFAFLLLKTNAQTVTDYDGNVYNTVIIGNQTWLKESSKSIHYFDGTTIPDVVAYNNDEGLAAIYGRLYTWNAAVRDSTTGQVQGICPCGWHIPSDAEWTILENFLGGPSVAGGKMKDTTAGIWSSPNTGATNSSGFTALPSGEFDAYYSPHIFQYLHQYSTYWTSTQYNSAMAVERYLSYDNQSSLPYNWYKVMKYAIRCIKNQNSGIPPSLNKLNFKIINPTGNTLQLIYDNKVNLKSFEIYNMQGQIIKKEAIGNSPEYISLEGLKEGFYIARFYLEKDVFVTKINKIE